MKRYILALAILLSAHVAGAQDSTFRLNVLAYQWTTTHNTITLQWPDHANTSCNGNVYATATPTGGGSVSANGTTSNNCSTTYTPATTQNIDVQKPVVFILADTESSRMILTCTRNVRWSQCHALTPGTFLARNEQGRFEVQATFEKGKEEWVRFDVVQQTAISRQQQQPAPAQEAIPSIDAPKAETANANSGYPARWKSMTTGSVRTLRFEGEYVYGEAVMAEAAAKAGAFTLMDVKKTGDKFVGKMNGRFVTPDGSKSCAETWPVELTLVTPNRIEGRAFTAPVNAELDWKSCTYSLPAGWQDFTWIPVR
jgi:hypothetical protein